MQVFWFPLTHPSLQTQVAGARTAFYDPPDISIFRGETLDSYANTDIDFFPLRPLLMQSETRIEKAGFRSFFFSTGLRIATLLIVRRIDYTVFVFFLETWRRLM